MRPRSGPQGAWGASGGGRSVSQSPPLPRPPYLPRRRDARRLVVSVGFPLIGWGPWLLWVLVRRALSRALPPHLGGLRVAAPPGAAGRRAVARRPARCVPCRRLRFVSSCRRRGRARRRCRRRCVASSPSWSFAAVAVVFVPCSFVVLSLALLSSLLCLFPWVRPLPHPSSRPIISYDAAPGSRFLLTSPGPVLHSLIAFSRWIDRPRAAPGAAEAKRGGGGGGGGGP